MKKIRSIVRLYLRWLILGGTMFFVLKAFKDRWQEVAAIRIDSRGWLMLAIALTITFLAHVWSGWVWSWILAALKQTVRQRWAIQVYLKTNLAKYLPGNVWHYYGRVVAISRAGVVLEAALLGALLEPLLMAAAAVTIVMASAAVGGLVTTSGERFLGLQLFALAGVLGGIHPAILNRALHLLSRLKGNNPKTEFDIARYPWILLLGELGFIGLRFIGFLFIFLAFTSVSASAIPQLFGTFSFAWLLGLIAPGAPGGLGVFEATAIALLNPGDFSAGIIVSVVALYRLVSILAEAMAAGIASIIEP